ncbi:MAG: radical SAM protein [Eubacteriales bacterium]|nr:radical SAM protein [Eubacteriales bacterium]
MDAKDLTGKIEEAYLVLRHCELCERRCRVDRTAGETGICGMTDELKAARAALHFWEEPFISGDSGSGAVFFSGCSLKCVFCQNHDISTVGFGKKIALDRLADIYIELQLKGASNINLITPTHYIPQVMESIRRARSGEDTYDTKLVIPVVYNTSSYENRYYLSLLDDTVDIYLADLKYYSDGLSSKYSRAPHYFETAFGNIEEMVRQKPLSFNGAGMMRSGVVIRILLLPGALIDAKLVLKKAYERFGENVWYSLMGQYTPIAETVFPELNRKVSKAEYDSFIDFARQLNIGNCLMQTGGADEKSFIPPFDLEGV